MNNIKECFWKFFNTMINDSFFALIVFSIISIFPLATVYILQYFFGVEPCPLCVYQRIPLFIIISLPILFAIPIARKFSFIGLIIVLFAILVNVALSFYHLGIENKWFENTLCTGITAKNSNNLSDFFLSTTTLFHKCDEVKFRFLGISLSGWNFIYSLGFFISVKLVVVLKFLKRGLS